VSSCDVLADDKALSDGSMEVLFRPLLFSDSESYSFKNIICSYSRTSCCSKTVQQTSQYTKKR